MIIIDRSQTFVEDLQTYGWYSSCRQDFVFTLRIFANLGGSSTTRLGEPVSSRGGRLRVLLSSAEGKISDCWVDLLKGVVIPVD